MACGSEDLEGPSGTTSGGMGGTTSVGEGGRDAAGGAGSGGEGGSEVVPAFIPAFIAFGHGGRSLLSCDGGKSFSHEHTFEEDGHDHSPYSALGRMAYGDGWFIGCVGWGHPTRIVRTRDGVNWEDLPDEAFVREDDTTERPGAGCSGIVHEGERFAFIAGGWLYTSADATTWRRHPNKVPGSGHLRRVGGGDGLIVAVREDTGAHMTEDGGDSWYTGSGWDTACASAVQRGGAIIAQGRHLVVGGRAGTFCVSGDRGHSFTSVVVNDHVTSMIWDGSRYVASGRSGELFVSADGLTWSTPGHDAGASLAAIAFHPKVGWAGVASDSQSFFASPDAETWTASSADGMEDEKLWIMVAGEVEPSPACVRPLAGE